MSYTPQSNTSPQVSKLDDDVFIRLRDFIYEKTGIFFAENKKYLLESRVSKRLAALGLETYSRYFSELMNGRGAMELSHLINSVTINETFFFRNEPQFKALEEIVLPELAERKMQAGANAIRIWSAACSTGEEAHTIALIIREKIRPKYPGVKFEIVGTDINTHVLETAAKGVYKDYAVRNIPKNYLGKYFKQDQDKYQLDQEVAAMSEFRQLNLFDRNMMRTMRNYDVVFAANVLIYFDFKSKQTVVSSIYDSLNKGGYFFIGYSETLYGLSQAFKPVHFEKTIAYRKE
ncbi:MAG TPA: protein-glutamate O-methyltransferase CheR [Candidatus Kryptonia bacterium]